MLRTLGGAAIGLAFPAVCAGCGSVGDAFLCEGCTASLPRAEEPRCPRCWDALTTRELCHHCAEHPPGFAMLRSPFALEGVAQEAVHRLKYGGLAAAGPAMAERMAAAWRDWNISIDIVVPTPLHPRRQRIRGYNQAAVLARPLASTLGIPVAQDAIRRSRATPPLAAGQGRDARWQALDRAFVPGPGRTTVVGKRVLLIDDVATTGATLSAAAETLRAAGAEGVVALVFARDGSAAPSPARGR